MKTIACTLLLCLAGLTTATAQNKATNKTLLRLLIYNEQKELLMIKVPEGFWVTPALYHTNNQTVRHALDSLAGLYGLGISAPQLNGLFSLHIAGNGTTSLRHFFTATVNSGQPTLPQGIAELQWMPVQKAIETLSFAHIASALQQIHQHPNTIWGGSYRMYKEGGKPLSEQTEPFYPLMQQ